jgi:hypothetical protein
MIRGHRKVTKADLDAHWHFDREALESFQLPPDPPESEGPSIFPPHVIRTRGRPRRDHTTRRDPSRHEILQHPPAASSARRPGRVGGEESMVSSIYNTMAGC